MGAFGSCHLVISGNLMKIVGTSVTVCMPIISVGGEGILLNF